jgi:hypothetical protein
MKLTTSHVRILVTLNAALSSIFGILLLAVLLFPTAKVFAVPPMWMDISRLAIGWAYIAISPILATATLATLRGKGTASIITYVILTCWLAFGVFAGTAH